ncbi:1,4-dihydroxy-2-naphthoate octaprenyltransferase [Orenia metallireducens]|uniref:1,4-dihydroxy-2-naphthoate octaprenyltransferase n=1 Tax=Orenia metallireducens TaxID=1413210 RepID=A0A285GNE5_9FIRM|nr:1,4-dihydroxy-2-naphthoate polyprenyltransferase [Orenia metallireducens]PRX29817.1 1,4-dihydroxy-2-naphthoate octaprenyltransferase [Orenia metallireducens]SNY25092.1 1,4-dihydroxy-2-naphthoate octaprenyltransferase [Orenia metallireducens]
MFIGSFLKLVEIQTKVASLIPFLIGTLYTLYRFDHFNLKNFILMLISLVAIDMATTAINNFIDYKQANKTHGYNYESHNAIVKDKLKESTVKAIILSLLAIAVFFGIILVFNTNLLVLFLGGISFGVGVLYSFGPLPISRTPLGEISSGFFMGFVITFISIYIHLFDQNLVSLFYEGGILSIKLNLMELIYIWLISIPLVSGIANIMLANNICDIDDDLENNRYTLPIYLGKKRSLQLFKVLYYLVYLDLIVLLALRVIPMTSSLTFLTLLPVKRNIELFVEKQSKKDTFILAVKNFVLINFLQILTLTLSIVI